MSMYIIYPGLIIGRLIKQLFGAIFMQNLYAEKMKVINILGGFICRHYIGSQLH